MTRTENDLRNALRELEQRAHPQDAPTTETILSAATSLGRHEPGARRTPRWLPPAAAAAVVAAAAVTAVVLQSGTSHPRAQQAGGQSTQPAPAPHRKTAASHPVAPRVTPQSAATAILDDAAAKLDAAPWTAPGQQDFYYVHTNQATTWTSVSGTRAGDGRAADGTRIWVAGCQDGHYVGGQSGSCTVADVPHYRANAPTTPAAWDAYLEQIAPGAKAANAQGKIIVQTLHEDLIAPKAAAALLRYTKGCPGLHTLDVAPVAGENLTGVTCTSMTNGSYGLAFDAASHKFVGYVGVGSDGRQDYPAEIVQKTGIVAAIGDRP